LLVVSFFFLVLLTLRAGPSYRFLSLFTPLMALSVARLLDHLRAGESRAVTTAVVALLVFETGYTVNSVITYEAIGPAPYLYARGPRSEVHRWGYNDLSDYLEEELAGKRPDPVIGKQYRFLERLRDEAVARQTRDGLAPTSLAIVFDGSLGAQSRTWAVLRWSIYHGWVVLDASDQLRLMKALETRDITGTGFDRYLFILPTNRIPLQVDGLTRAGEALERELIARAAEPLRLRNAGGEEIFRIYDVDASSPQSRSRLP
jgi:hypothetical protein